MITRFLLLPDTKGVGLAQIPRRGGGGRLSAQTNHLPIDNDAKQSRLNPLPARNEVCVGKGLTKAIT